MFFNILGIIVSVAATIFAIVFVGGINDVSSYDSCFENVVFGNVCYCFKKNGSIVKRKSLPLMFYKVLTTFAGELPAKLVTKCRHYDSG